MHQDNACKRTWTIWDNEIGRHISTLCAGVAYIVYCISVFLFDGFYSNAYP